MFVGRRSHPKVKKRKKDGSKIEIFHCCVFFGTPCRISKICLSDSKYFVMSKDIEMGKKCDACSLKVRQGPKCLVSRSCRALGRGAGQGGAWAAALRLLLCPNWLPSSLPPCLSCCPVEEEASNVCPFQARLPSALFLLNELSTPASPCRAQLL